MSDVAVDPQRMLFQLSMPIDPRDTIKARRERAIRRSGLTPSKGYRLWYGIAELWRDEYLELRARYERHVVTLEKTLAQESEQLRALREAREMRERHHAFAFDQTASAGVVRSEENAT